MTLEEGEGTRERNRKKKREKKKEKRQSNCCLNCQKVEIYAFLQNKLRHIKHFKSLLEQKSIPGQQGQTQSC